MLTFSVFVYVALCRIISYPQQMTTNQAVEFRVGFPRWNVETALLASRFDIHTKLQIKRCFSHQTGGRCRGLFFFSTLDFANWLRGS